MHRVVWFAACLVAYIIMAVFTAFVTARVETTRGEALREVDITEFIPKFACFWPFSLTYVLLVWAAWRGSQKKI